MTVAGRGRWHGQSIADSVGHQRLIPGIAVVVGGMLSSKRGGYACMVGHGSVTVATLTLCADVNSDLPRLLGMHCKDTSVATGG